MRDKQASLCKLRHGLIAAVAVTLAGSICLADPAPATQPSTSPRHHEEPTAAYLSGAIASYNLAPNGLPDALMVQVDGKLAQVNCPPEIASAISQAAPIGDQVKISAVAQRPAVDHPVYQLVMLTNSKGQQIGGPRSEPTPAHVEAAVKQLNYGRRGELNGALLDNGDLVQISPASATQLKLTVGQKLTIEGKQHPMLLGHNAILAQTINGFAIIGPPVADGDEGRPHDERRPGDSQRDGAREHRQGPPEQAERREERGRREGPPGGEERPDAQHGPRDGGRRGGPPDGQAGPDDQQGPGPRGHREGPPGGEERPDAQHGPRDGGRRGGPPDGQAGSDDQQGLGPRGHREGPPGGEERPDAQHGPRDGGRRGGPPDGQAGSDDQQGPGPRGRRDGPPGGEERPDAQHGPRDGGRRGGPPDGQAGSDDQQGPGPR